MVANRLQDTGSAAILDEPPAFTRELARRIRDLLKARLGNIASELRIDVAEDLVVLSGLAPSFYVKQAATHAALEAIDALVENPFAVALRNEIAVV